MAADQPRRDPLRELAELAGNPEELAGQAVPFGAKPPGPKRAEISDMVLPPAALVDELDNSAPSAPEPEPDDEEVTLDFFGDDLPVRDFPLRHPFAWAGERVEVVEVRQLTTADVGRMGQESVDLYAVYARMCRNKATGTPLPARVLRKLPAVDGLPIVQAAFDFLPPSFRVEAV